MKNKKNRIILLIAIIVLLVFIAAAIYFVFFKKDKQTEYAAPSNVPVGWQVIKDVGLGVQLVVPQSLQFEGCTQPVKFGVVDGQLMVGALWTPCKVLMNLNKYSDNFVDMFSGYGITVLKNVKSAQEATDAFEKAWGENCKIKFSNLEKGIFIITDAKVPVNQWAPHSCGGFSDHPNIVHGFYNVKTRNFFIWAAQPQHFPIGLGKYADSQVQILPY